MTTKTYRLYRGKDCPGPRSCVLCIEHFPALADDVLLISSPSLALHAQEIEDVVRACPSGAICLDEVEP